MMKFGAKVAKFSYMQNAINEALKCKIDVPVGCVIKKNGEIIAQTCNRRELDDDVTSHAEILAIVIGKKVFNDIFIDLFLYIFA